MLGEKGGVGAEVVIRAGRGDTEDMIMGRLHRIGGIDRAKGLTIVASGREASTGGEVAIDLPAGHETGAIPQTYREGEEARDIGIMITEDETSILSTELYSL